MESWQIDVIERQARMEETLIFLKENIRDLPQSKQCAADIHSLKEDVSALKAFKEELNRKVAYIGGVLVTVGMAVPYIIKWIVDHLHFRIN